MHPFRHVKNKAVAEVGIVKWDARFTTRPFRLVKNKLVKQCGHFICTAETHFDW